MVLEIQSQNLKEAPGFCWVWGGFFEQTKGAQAQHEEILERVGKLT